MAKILTGSTLSYGQTLPPPEKTADGSVFFLTSAYSDNPRSPTNKSGNVIERSPGLHIFSFQTDANPNVLGDQVGQAWKQISSLDKYISSTGGSMSGPLEITTNSGPLIHLIGTSPGIRFTETDGSVDSKEWLVVADGDAFRIQTRTDAYGQITTPFTVFRDGVIRVNDNKVWHEGNVGAGSGLDADKLDGYDSSYYLNAANFGSGVLAVSRGGTGTSSTVQGGVLFGATTTTLGTSIAGEPSQLLQSGGTGAPSWISPSSLIVGSALSLKAGADPAGRTMVFHWGVRSGQPTWIWGGEDPGTDMHVYNPSNFSVSYAENTGKLDNKSSSEAASNSTIVARDSSARIFGSYFNSSAPLNDGTAIANVVFSDTGGTFRKASLSSLSTAMGLGASYVSKSGADSMTGTLTINGISLNYNTNQILTSGNIQASSIHSTGTITASSAISGSAFSNAGAGTGFVMLTRGGPTNTGYIEFYAANGIRQGFIGYSATTSSDETYQRLEYRSGIHSFVGAIESNGNVTAYSSDGRLKTNVVPIQDAVKKVLAIGGYSYDWDMEKTRRLGFYPVQKHEHGLIAQEVEKVMPDAVAPAPFNSEYKTIRYERLVALLSAAICEQQAQINALISEVEDLKAK